MKPQIRNVIYIHTHDMGRYIQPYGYAVPTPALQKFAERSLLFRQAFCCGPTCSPSRAGLLTGVTPHQSGMLGLAHRGFSLDRPEQHLASYLRSQGFTTVLCGIQHEFDISTGTQDLPYDRILTQRPSTDKEKTEAAIDFLNQKHDQPFFLSFGLFSPHRKFSTADYNKYRPEFIQPPAPLPDTPEIRRDMADYHYTMQTADANLGEVLEVIHRTGRDEDSLIFITTDHGIAFPEMKCNLSDHGIGVTLMIDYPDNSSRGQSTDSLVSHIDLFPTICDLLRVPKPDYLQGQSLVPILEKPGTEIRKEIYSEVTFHAAYEPMRCIRTKRFKYIRRYCDGQRRLSNCDNSPSKDYLIEHGWTESLIADEALYDVILDPNEARNLSCTPQLKQIKETLSAQLDAWMQATDDPLLKGNLGRPKGAIVNMIDSKDSAVGPYEAT